MALVPLRLKGVSKIAGNDKLGLLELVTDDGLMQLSVICDGVMVHQFGLRLADAPIRQKLLPEVLWRALGEGWKLQMSVIIADFHDGEYLVFLHNEQTQQRWPVRASDGVLLSVIAGLPLYADDYVMERCAAPADSSGKLVIPISLLPTEIVRKALRDAIDREDYEQASHLRDELKKREQQPS